MCAGLETRSVASIRGVELLVRVLIDQLVGLGLVAVVCFAPGFVMSNMHTQGGGILHIEVLQCSPWPAQLQPTGSAVQLT